MQKLVHFSFLVVNTTVGGRERVEMLIGQKTVSEATEGELHDESQRGFWVTHKDTRGEEKKPIWKHEADQSISTQIK